MYDHFIKSNNVIFTGLHILMDFKGINKPNEEVNAVIENALNVVNATVLHKNIHNFPDNDGITGCYVLAESHLTYHSWWEAEGTLIMDLFTCGTTNPLNALRVLRDGLHPTKSLFKVVPRGPLYFNNKNTYNVYLWIDPRNDKPFQIDITDSKNTKCKLIKKKNLSKCEMLINDIINDGLTPLKYLVTENTTIEIANLIKIYLNDFYETLLQDKDDKPDNSEDISTTLKKLESLFK